MTNKIIAIACAVTLTLGYISLTEEESKESLLKKEIKIEKVIENNQDLEIVKSKEKEIKKIKIESVTVTPAEIYRRTYQEEYPEQYTVIEDMLGVYSENVNLEDLTEVETLKAVTAQISTYRLYFILVGIKSLEIDNDTKNEIYNRAISYIEDSTTKRADLVFVGNAYKYFDELFKEYNVRDKFI